MIVAFGRKEDLFIYSYALSVYARSIKSDDTRTKVH